MSKLLLAIGGPREFDWLPYSEYHSIKVPKPLKVKVFESAPEISSVVDFPHVVYKKQKLADTDTRKVKEVYVIEGMDLQEADRRLKDFLVKQFINMEDPID